MEPALFTEIPAAREHFPWVAVGKYPTRVERLRDVVGPDVGLWVKREDLGGERFGGNKVRKLEFIFGEARARGARRLVTFGSYGSSHVAATATYAPRFGLELEALLFPEASTDIVRRNLEIVRASGARIRMLHHVAEVFPHRVVARRARDAFWVAGGGSSPAGALGWVSGAFEILEQVRSGQMPRPAAVYVALGSGATFAGLCWGLRGDPPIEVVGVEVVEPAWWCRWQARKLVREIDLHLAPLAGASLGAPPKVRIVRGSRRIEDDAAIARARHLGLSLDPVYTTPTLDALLRDVRDGRWRGREVLFIDSLNGVDA
jgi:1-aminocyclopropane-1-carboxylate deaminase/D-cysteine desulfhydrase-like pyridoxal-dependent ACC family enzyme